MYTVSLMFRINKSSRKNASKVLLQNYHCYLGDDKLKSRISHDNLCEMEGFLKSHFETGYVVEIITYNSYYGMSSWTVRRFFDASNTTVLGIRNIVDEVNGMAYMLEQRAQRCVEVD